MKRLVFLFLCIVSLSSLLFAMGGKEENVTHVTIWHSSQGNALSIFEEIIDEFNDTVGKEKGIEVEAIYQGKANDVLTKVNAAIISSTLPDIAMMDATAALDMNNSEKTVTLEELNFDTSSILPSALNNFTSQRGTIALPFNGSALLYYYNKTVFDENGVSEPKTIDDMISLSKVLGSNNISFFEGVPATYELSYFICAQNGGTYMVNNRNGHDGYATEVLFGKEGTYKAFLEKWKALYDTGYASSVSSGVQDDFVSGRTLSMLSSSSNLTAVINSVGDSFEVGVSPVPVVNEAATGGAIVSGGALFSFTSSEAVKTVLEYLVSPSVQAKWSENTGYIPVNTETYSEPAYISFIEKNPLYKVASDYVLSSKESMVNVWLPSAYTIYYSFQKNVVDVISGKSIDTAVSEMEKTVEDAINTYRAQN